jgi:RNA polymerase sigma factor (sigma-70 family)
LHNDFNIHKLSDHLFRHESGKMVAVLTRIFGTQNLELSEDVVQDTFVQAMKIWTLKGVPDNPSAWLMRAAKNRAIDVLRRNKFSRLIDFSDPEYLLLKSAYTIEVLMEKLWQEEAIPDDLLRMMFACCHPDLAPENQIALMLKTLCGFSTAEIAKAFLASEETLAKRLYRTRKFFKINKIQPAFPQAALLGNRTATVLKAIYLLFNEGYYATHTPEPIRKDLLDQSVYLCGLLLDNKETASPEVYAAMALMYFHLSRIDGRLTAEGEIILLAHQDRSKWNGKYIDTANDYLNKAAFGDTISSYHIEAAIAYEHCIAKTFEATNWNNILKYYDLLLALYPGEVAALNRLAVFYKLHGPTKTLQQIGCSQWESSWRNNHLYYALLGDIYAETNFALARLNYQQAIELTSSAAEKKLLHKKMVALPITHSPN